MQIIWNLLAATASIVPEHLTPRIPCRDQVELSGKEAGFEQTKKHSHWDQWRPALHETETLPKSILILPPDSPSKLLTRMTMPNANTLPDMKILGPIFVSIAAAGSWASIYGAKKTSRIRDWNHISWCYQVVTSINVRIWSRPSIVSPSPCCERTVSLLP